MGFPQAMGACCLSKTKLITQTLISEKVRHDHLFSSARNKGQFCGELFITSDPFYLPSAPLNFIVYVYFFVVEVCGCQIASVVSVSL